MRIFYNVAQTCGRSFSTNKKYNGRTGKRMTANITHIIIWCHNDQNYWEKHWKLNSWSPIKQSIMHFYVFYMHILRTENRAWLVRRKRNCQWFNLFNILPNKETPPRQPRYSKCNSWFYDITQIYLAIFLHLFISSD